MKLDFNTSPMKGKSIHQGVISQGVETSGVERSSCDEKVWVLPKRQKKDGGHYTGQSERLSNESQPLSRGIHLLQAIAMNKLFFSHVRFLFCSLSMPETCLGAAWRQKKCRSFLKLPYKFSGGRTISIWLVRRVRRIFARIVAQRVNR